MPGTLYLVGTPIGNLEDITLRALRILREVNLILAEDTRRTRKLLSHYDIHTPLQSYHEHNERALAPRLLDRQAGGENLALVTDAGLPGISDPGTYLVKLAIERGLPVAVIPGPTAFASALVVSGLSTQRFAFWGFPPRQGRERAEIFRAALDDSKTAIFYEAPTRLARTLKDLAALVPDRPAAVVRELTKVHEEVSRGTLAQLAGVFSEREVKGEVCLVIEGKPANAKHSEETAGPAKEADAVTLVENLLSQGYERKEALREAARCLGLSRRAVYSALLTKKIPAPKEREAERF
ncbi:MAG: rRNA (cytidine1402-2-O)-methyltransferase [Bacillota bacterium]|jgi:16S rRNA (cytidine1402-2'-O)-methyltransferase|nr:rRNA (cytidine1402-2-O)-methyltransferase [Bacillota bacterium]